jgi:acetyltransferase
MLRCGMSAHNQPPQLSPARNATLFRPCSVALLAEGDTRDAEVIARNLAAGGFSGKLYASGLPAPGMEAVAAVEELPEAPDLAVVCVPEPALEAAVAGLARRGCRAVIVPGAAPIWRA